MQININSMTVTDSVQIIDGAAHLPTFGLRVDGNGAVTRTDGNPAGQAELHRAQQGLRAASEGMITGAEGMESGARSMEGTVAASGAAGMRQGAQEMRVSAAQFSRLADLAHL